MRFGSIAENLLERVVLASGQIPTPFSDPYGMMILSRMVIVATKIGVFDALCDRPLTAAEVARCCSSHPESMKKLLDTLVASRYLKLQGDRYALTAMARKWLVKDSSQSLHDATMLRFMDWEWLRELEHYITSGQPVDIHGTMSPENWGIYQRGMRSIAGLGAGEMVKSTPFPKPARDMLDIGGSHGYYSVAFCRKYPELRSTILDLPQAVEQAAPILAKEGMGDRVRHRAGNVLTDDLGVEQYDLILMAQVVHHFDDATNRQIAKKVARALRPGGYFVIQEAIRRQSPMEGGQFAALLDLYFAMTSESGTWSFAEMAGWQSEAGLIPQQPIRFLTIPGVGEQVGIKPR